MKRLVAFGCSLTYGHGLQDCFDPPIHPGPVPSKFSWPSIVANRMGRKCVNLSTPGASNKRIWNAILNFKFKPDDVVFILWSYVDRSSIINRFTIKDLGPWQEEKFSKEFYKECYSGYDAFLQSKLFVNHANLFLKEKSITVHNLTIKKEFKKVFELKGSIVPHIPLYVCEDFRYYFPMALDNAHPGQECHSVFGEAIVTYINSGKITTIPFMEKIKWK